MATGTVKWFNAQKGYGFIQPTSGGPDVFVHISAVERAGMDGLDEGQKLSYELEQGQRGRRYLLAGEDHTYPGLMRLLAGAAGLRPRLTPRLGPWVMTVAATLSGWRSWLTRREGYLTPNHARLNRYYWFARSDRAARELGFRPRPLAETFHDAHRWYRDAGRVRLRGFAHWWMRPAA